MTTPVAFRAQDQLENIREYFEDRADASCEPGDTRFRGNKEMSLLNDVEAVDNAIVALCKAISDAVTKVEPAKTGNEIGVVNRTTNSVESCGFPSATGTPSQFHDSERGA